MMESMWNELQREEAVTRRLLERVPEDRLSWTPHPKSMSLGQLALHVAQIPGNISRMAQLDEFDASTASFDPPAPGSKAEILAELRQSVATATLCLGSLTPEAAAANWRLTLRGDEMFAMPRIDMLRSLLLNHWYHHRGQLSVYLRLLNVAVPVIYGRSADESPFA